MGQSSHTWRVGVEVELLAPRGSDRRALADHIAGAVPSREVRRVFHHESEPSKVVGQPVFENLTLGFEVYSADDQLVARCVDDLTIQDELDRAHPPRAGWFRVVSDEARLLRLTARHADLTLGLPHALAPVAALFGCELEPCGDGMFRLCDEAGASILIAAPLPGERERPCELITPPLEEDRADSLQSLLASALELGFSVPQEGALHVHYDAQPLKHAPVIRRLIQTLSQWGEPLKELVGVNPRCRRLGPWDPSLVMAAETPHFDELSWEEASALLASQPLTKYCDFNLSNFILGRTDKDTFEVRIFPSTSDVEVALADIALFEALLLVIISDVPLNTPAPQRLGAWSTQLTALLRELNDRGVLSDEHSKYWRQRVAEM